MDERRQQTYFDLIQALLNCSNNDEVLGLLKANQELIDVGLIQTIQQVVKDLIAQGNLYPAIYLGFIADKLLPFKSTLKKDQETFLSQILQATADTYTYYDANPQVVNSLLAANIDKIDDNLADMLKTWAVERLLNAELKEAQYIAAVISDFSFFMEQFNLGRKEINLEIAIIGYEATLLVDTREAFPELWARTQYNLGNAYHNRIRGDKADNLEMAINAFKNALELYTCDTFFPFSWAATQNNLGSAYRNRIRGNKADNLELAINAYENALKVDNLDAFPEIWAMTQYNLGNAYCDRIRGEKADNLELAIYTYNNALKVRTRNAFPQDWAMTEYNLGNAYSERIRGEKADNLELAINAYNHALEVFTRDAFPKDWAMTQNHLGNAYSERIRGEKADNLELAINTIKNALSVYTRDAFPSDWARIQNHLGGAYYYRIRGDKADNLELAINAYKNALPVHTHDAFPSDWALAQNNLGLTYSERIKGDKEENLELAINACKNALLVYTHDAFPKDWAMTQNNLGLAYYHRIRGEKADNLELAINAYKNALKVRTRDASPQYWAETQNNLGLAYSQRIRGKKAENLELTINAYENALNVLTRDTFPQHWAMIQNNLGYAYSQRIKGDKEENLKQAIACYRSALEIYTFITLPIYCLRAGGNLGNLAFNEGLWSIAIEGYEQAIAAVELSRSWAPSDSGRQEIITEAIDVYFNLVQACVNAGQLEKAIRYAESSRSRRLVDLMASNDLYSTGEIPPLVKEYLQQYESVQQQIDQELNQLQFGEGKELVEAGTPPRSRATLEAHTEKIKRLEASKQYIWEKIRSFDQVLAGQIKVDSLDFATMRQLIDKPTTAILNLYSTINDTHIFVLRQNLSPQLHTCPEEDLNTLNNWIYQNWFLPYLQNKAEWVSQMGDFLKELAQRLKIDDLIAQHLEGIEEIIIIPHICLHQIPFAALPTKNGFIGDKFSIRYAPSTQILKFCHDRQRVEDFHKTSLKYGIVENATDDLYFTDFECEKITQIYPDSERLQGSKKATVSNYRQLAKKVNGLHSSHHASSRLDNPLESRLYLGDGGITLGELMSPGWRLPQLMEVFLSCCETNFGNSKITDDPLTLSTGFLCAGASSVINTLWSVDDLATALFSIFYYEFRQQDYNHAQAVRKSQAKLRTLSGEEFKNQYEQELNDMLTVKKQQAERERKAVKELRPQSKDTPAYQEWEKKYKESAEVVRKIGDSQKRLANLCQQAKPFEHLMYWAGFCCQGIN